MTVKAYMKGARAALILQLILFGLAMGANNAIASVALGTSQLSRARQFSTALIFAVFEALMPVIGMVVGETVAGNVGSKAKWVGVAVLCLMGIYNIVKRDAEEDEVEKVSKTQGAGIIFLALALSLDNLTVGFGVGMFHAPIALAAIIFGGVSLLMTLIGLEIGRFLGKRVSLSADKLAGTVLLIVAGFMAFV